MTGHRYWRFNLLKNASNAFSSVEIAMRTSPGGSNVATGGTAFSTQAFNGSTTPDKAFDNNTGTLWSSTNGAQGQVIGYDFGVGVTPDIVEFTWRSRNDGSWPQAPTSFIVQYSDDSTNYTDAWFVSAFGLWSQNVTLTFTKPSTNVLYRYWRNWITASDKGDITSMAEISLIGSGSNLLTGGTASASSVFSGQPASQAVDGNGATVWATTNSGDATPPWWWSYDFGVGGGITGFNKLTITSRTDGPNQLQTPSTGIIQCSTDGASFTNYFSYTAVTPWTTGQTQTFLVFVPGSVCGMNYQKVMRIR